MSEKAELLERGYEEIRKAVNPDETHEDFNVLELVDDVDEPVVRLSDDDERVEVVSDPGENPYQLRISLSGDDAEVDLPETIAGGRFYCLDEDNEEVTEIGNFTVVTLEEDEDSVSVTGSIEIPEIEE
ncbi:MAG: hypothetical protein EF811_04015 [Methanonatronarchaeia archaeon]|nr:MAG: hypothetical protein EF811_04015 [Methanonatronarchaeia archaeon]